MNRVLIAALAGLISSNAQALDPTRAISQYAHTAWRIQDGFFSGPPTSITQTTDGYLWIGTANGLFRFDGVRFVAWSESSGQKQLESMEISALLGGRDGSLWIGAGYRLYRWKGHALSQYSTRDEFVDPIIETRQGSIWLARQRYGDQDGPLCQVQDGGLHCYSQGDRVPFSNATSLAEDRSGNLWTGNSTELLRWRSGRSTAWTLKSLRLTEGLEGVKALAVDRHDSLWVGLDYPGPGLGLKEFRDGVWKTFLSPQLNGSRIAVSRLFVDREGALWVGTESQGIYRIDDGKADHFDSADGLSSDKISAIFQDHEGTIWIATSKGIDNFRDLPVVTLSRREGLHLDKAQSILSSINGTIWIGNERSLEAWRNGGVSSILPKDGLPGREVTSLLQDPAGGLWVGIDNGLFRIVRGKFVPVITPGRDNIVFAMTPGVNGNVWVATAGPITGRLVEINDGHLKVWRTFPPGEAVLALATDPQGRLWIAGDKLRYLQGSKETTINEFGPRYGYIRNIAVDRDSFVWFGATKGLVGFKDGNLQTMTSANGLPCERINTLILDNQRSLWLYAQCGLIRIDHNELEDWWRHPGIHVKNTLFGALDGFQGGPSPFRPAAAKSSDGHLWFVNGSVVQTINPSLLFMNPLPPPVHIERVIANTKDYSPENPIRLPELTRDIEIKYTALSFVVPQFVRFRYRLDSYDADWQEAGVRRSAIYTKLGPGKYTFRVIACNNDGVWNEVGAHLDFSIAPAWYQTYWFRVACAGLFLAFLWGLYQIRLQQLRKQFNVRLEERVHERTRIARELHDTLLQGLHGLMFEFQAARNMFGKRPDEALQALDGAIMGTEWAITESQDAIENLRTTSKADKDLTQLVKMVGEDLVASRNSDSDSPTFGLTVEGQPRVLTSAIREEIYRITRELLRNAFRHAQACRVEAEILYEEDQLRVRVRDDGKGIDPQVLKEGRRSGHWGLPGIRERAFQIGAKLDVWSEEGAGTEVQLAVAASAAYQKTAARSGFGVTL